MEFIQNQIFDQERALYGSENLHVAHCTFDGPADGESAFKECRDIQYPTAISICDTRSGMTRVWKSTTVK